MTAELGQPGQIIDGKYRIVRMLGTGGMGAVFEGENLRIRRKVAIKMLHGSVSSQPDVIARFEREAQAAALVGSDHICEVLDMGMLPDQTRYMVMEYLDGDTLSGLIKKAGRLAPLQSIPILLQILDALGAAHSAGIIHRDLKPDNVFILPQKGGVTNFVKILDFGVSKFSQLGGEAMNVTRAGAVVGTPYYMSPEQARGSSAIDNRTDVYAIGVLLYQATTGQVPYQAETFNELLFKIVLEVAPPPQTYVPNLDPEFAAIIQRAMAREPAERYQSCKQFHEALVAYHAMRTGGPIPGLPKLHDGAPMMRTEMLDLSSIPGRPSHPSHASSASSSSNFAAVSSPSWPGSPPATEGTLPMQPGLQLGMPSSTGLGNAMSPMSPMSPMSAGASAANWGSVSVPGAAPAGNTANSWGNASSPSNAIVRPKRGNGMLIGVVFVAALVGVGVAVAAFFLIGKPEGGVSATQPSATATAMQAVAPAPSTPTPNATADVVAPTPSSASTTATAPVDSAVPSATASAASSAGAGAPGAASATSATSGHPVPGPMPGGASTVKGSTGRQNGAGTTKPLPKSGGKSGGTELGY